jgi:hypothetical protein
MALYEVVYVVEPISATSAYSVFARSLEEAKYKVNEFLSLDTELIWQIAGSQFNETVIPVQSFDLSLGVGDQYNVIIYSKPFPPEARVVVQAANTTEALVLANGSPKTFVWYGLNLGALPDYPASSSVTQYAYLANIDLTINAVSPLTVGLIAPIGSISGAVSITSLVPVDSFPTPPPPFPVINNGDVLIRFDDQSLTIPVINGTFSSPSFVPLHSGNFPLLVNYNGFIRNNINYKTAFNTSSMLVARGTVSIPSVTFTNASGSLTRGSDYIISFTPSASQSVVGEFDITFVDSASNVYSFGIVEGYYNNPVSGVITIPESSQVGSGTVSIYHNQNSDFASETYSFPVSIV